MVIINLLIFIQIFILSFFFVTFVNNEIFSYSFYYFIQPLLYYYPILISSPILFMLFEIRDYKAILVGCKLLKPDIGTL
jgi:hypothetical protein